MKDEKVVDKALRSSFSPISTRFGKLESRKPRVTIRRPFQVGIAVYQLAKLRMLEFYYDFLDRFVDRSDFELIQMDTDSNYMAISGDSLEEVIKPELRAQFEAEKKKEAAGLGQVEQPRARVVQAGIRGVANDRALLKVLLR